MSELNVNIYSILRFIFIFLLFFTFTNHFGVCQFLIFVIIIWVILKKNFIQNSFLKYKNCKEKFIIIENLNINRTNIKILQIEGSKLVLLYTSNVKVVIILLINFQVKKSIRNKKKKKIPSQMFIKEKKGRRKQEEKRKKK